MNEFCHLHGSFYVFFILLQSNTKSKHMNVYRWMFITLISCFIVGCSKTVIPRTFLIEPTALVTNKQKIKSGDKILNETLVGLKIEADKTLTEDPYSVTYKTKVPPSGDKHDYMSVGPYWWPDTTKPDGLPYIRRDGEINPERFEIKDAEYFKDLCHNVRLLAVVHYFTDEDKYSTKAVELLRAWFLDEATRMNPNLNYGQAIPGITEGRGIGLIDTRFLVYLIDAIQILQACERLSVAEYDGLQIWFRQFLDWMTTSPVGLDEADEHNNHGTYYDVQTVAMALFTGQKDRAIQMLEQQTKQRIENQIAEDGSQPHELARTLSWSYSQMNLSGFFELAGLAENVDLDLWNYVSSNRKSIKKAYLWMLPYANGKTWEYKQIKPADKSVFVTLARIATIKYPDVDASDFLKQYQDEKPDDLFVLTH